MSSSKLTAVDKRDPSRGEPTGQYSPKRVCDQVLPWYLYFVGLLQRDILACACEIVAGSGREPRSLWSQSNSSIQQGLGSLWLYTGIKLYLKPPGVVLLRLGVSPDMFTLCKHTRGKSMKRLAVSTVRGSTARCNKS